MMMELATAKYLRCQSDAHIMGAHLKIFLLAVYSAGIFFIGTWWGIAVYAAALIAMLALFRPPIKSTFSIALPVYALVGVTIAFNIFTPVDGEYGAYIEGLVRGCFFASRILLLLWASMAVCLSVQPEQVTLAFSKMMSPLAKLGVPVDAVSTVLSIALRFIPLTVEEFFAVRDAQWARCASFDEGGLASRIRAYAAVFVPLFVALVKRADRLASAMDLRCFGMLGARITSIHDERATTLSLLATAALTVLMIAAAIIL